MQIVKYSSEVTSTIEAWAGANGYAIDKQKTQGSIHLTKDDHGFEFIAEEGFAYVHGEGALNGIGSTIMDLDQFEATIATLLENLS